MNTAAAGAGVDAAARWICSSMSRMHCFDMVIYVRRWAGAGAGATGAAGDGGSVAILLSSVIVPVVIVWSATTVDVFLRK